jgi:hypothetical protein
MARVMVLDEGLEIKMTIASVIMMTRSYAAMIVRLAIVMRRIKACIRKGCGGDNIVMTTTTVA